MVQSKNPDSTSRYRTRRSFAKIPAVMDVPNLIAIQTESFKRFMEDGLTERFRRTSAPSRIQHQRYVRRVRRA